MRDAVKKRIRIAAITLVSIVALLVVFLLVSLAILSVMYSPTYTYRLLAYGESSITDYKRVFPYRDVANQEPAFHFDRAEQALGIGKLTYSFAGRTTTIDNFQDYLEKSRTTAFIVTRDDRLLYEKYSSGYTRDSINRSFSMAKSFTSTLVGMAVQDGYIHSIADPIVTYLPEMKGRGLDQMTIRDLMLMNSGIKYSDPPDGLLFLAPFYDEPILYYIPDMRTHALAFTASGDPIGAYFYYHNGYPQLEGLILERTTHKTVSAYLEEKIWKPLGMEYPATWSLYSEGNLEQMGGGINARAIDFAKFGRLFLNKGNWNSRQLIPASWVIEATTPDPADSRPFKNYPGWKEMGGYYKYHWWGMRNPDGTYDYAALGHLGQMIYISPSHNAVIVRNGFTGDSDEWSLIARAILQSLK